MDSTEDHILVDTNTQMGVFDLTSPFSNSGLLNFSASGDEDFWRNLEGFDTSLTDEIENVFNRLDGSDGDFPSPQTYTEKDDASSDDSRQELSIQKPPLLFPCEDMQIDNQISIHHLLKAYAEAMEREETGFADVIHKCISEKANPTGHTLERLAFFSFQSNQEAEYLKQESMKNYKIAFKAFFRLFPPTENLLILLPIRPY